MTMIIVSTDYCTIMLNPMYAIKMVAYQQELGNHKQLVTNDAHSLIQLSLFMCSHVELPAAEWTNGYNTSIVCEIILR